MPLLMDNKSITYNR